MQHLELVDELLAHRGEDVAGRHRAVCLHADEELGDVGVADCGWLAVPRDYLGEAKRRSRGRTLVTGHEDVGVQLKVLGEQVAESMVLLLE